MVTKTKPKKAVDNDWVPVKISKADRTEILSSLGLDEVDSTTQSNTIKALEEILACRFNYTRLLPDRPQPAHTKAALDIILRAAKKMNAALHPDVLHWSMEEDIDANIDFVALRGALTDLSFGAKRMIKEIIAENKRGSGGDLKFMQKDAKQLSEIVLKKFFNKNAKDIPKDIQAACHKDFIENCLKYISPEACKGIRAKIPVYRKT